MKAAYSNTGILGMSLSRLARPGWNLLLFAIAFFCFGARPLADPDEGRYAEVAREMVASGDWLIPRMSGHEHMTKPPFTYWITGLGLKILGMNEWGARVFVACACFGTLLVMVELARTWNWTSDQAHAAGLVFATSLLTFASGHILTTDIFLTFWETLGILAAWKVWAGKANATRWRWVFWTAFGMAFLTKGPPGWIPLAAIVAFTLARKPGRQPQASASLWSPMPFIAFLLLSSSWYLAVILRDPSRLEYFVKNETLDRVFSSVHHRNNPFWIYPPLIFAGALPWVFLWPELIRRTRRRIKLGWSGMTDVQQFSALWFGVSLVVFTVSKSRMPLYVVPMMVCLCLWEGRVLVEMLERIASTSPLRTFLKFLAPVWIALMATFTVYPETMPFNKTYRALGLALRDRPELKDPNTKIYWMGDEVYQSLAFYAQAVVFPLNEDHDDVPYIAKQAFAAGERPIYATKTSRLDKFKVDPREMGTLIESGPGSAIIYKPN